DAPAYKKAGSARERFLLLSADWRLIKGILSETENDYLVEQKIGMMRFPKKRVEGSFDSVRAAYEYLLAQLPAQHSDESMKLAVWCLNQALSEEARGLIVAILEQNPNHPKAKAMLVSIDHAAARLALRGAGPDAAGRERDPEVRQTEAEMTSDRKPQ